MTVRAHPAVLAGPAIDWRGLSRLLVVRPDNLGDVLMAGPALRALRRSAPDAHLDLLAAPAGAPAAALLPEVDGVLTASVSWQQADPDEVPVTDDLELVARIAAGGYDAAVILTSFSQSPWPAGYLCRLAGVPIRVGMSKEFGGAGLTHWVPAPDTDSGTRGAGDTRRAGVTRGVGETLHEVDRSLHLLQQVGVAPVSRRLHAVVPPAARRSGRYRLTELGVAPHQPYALILPGASCAARRYPPDRLARVARLLVSSGLRVVVAGTAKEAEPVAAVTRECPKAVGLVGQLEVPELAQVVAESRVVVCNNSGGAHLANALGTPVVVLFSGTERIAQYRPRFGPAAVLTVGTDCSPCRQFVCPYALECLDIAPERVATAALRLAGRVHA
ncbi:MAG TPA: glycosyltransferase family 9 protein [Micromonosporaceae bacterium]|nr:glycosyltransferase family 9 protein [Micromonosporaceae bacterium]